MARWLLLLIIVIIAVSPAIVFLYVSKTEHAVSPELQKKREAAYQSALQAYAQELKPGMNRKDVENYLRAKGVGFRQMCCIEQWGAFADLVKIGQEKAPWFCSENYVYVAFEFTSAGLKPDLHPADADTFKMARIFRQLGGCL